MNVLRPLALQMSFLKPTFRTLPSLASKAFSSTRDEWVYNIVNNMYQLPSDEGNTLSRIISGRKTTAKSDLEGGVRCLIQKNVVKVAKISEEGSPAEARKEESSSVEECRES